MGGVVLDLENTARAMLVDIPAWISEPDEPLERLRRSDAAYVAVAELIRLIGAEGLRGHAARDLVHDHGLDKAAELAGYTLPTMRRVAWK